jgi:hypothetical protein
MGFRDGFRYVVHDPGILHAAVVLGASTTKHSLEMVFYSAQPTRNRVKGTLHLDSSLAAKSLGGHGFLPGEWHFAGRGGALSLEFVANFEPLWNPLKFLTGIKGLQVAIDRRAKPPSLSRNFAPSH